MTNRWVILRTTCYKSLNSITLFDVIDGGGEGRLGYINLCRAKIWNIKVNLALLPLFNRIICIQVDVVPNIRSIGNIKSIALGTTSKNTTCWTWCTICRNLLFRAWHSYILNMEIEIKIHNTLFNMRWLSSARCMFLCLSLRSHYLYISLKMQRIKINRDKENTLIIMMQRWWLSGARSTLLCPTSRSDYWYI